MKSLFFIFTITVVFGVSAQALGIGERLNVFEKSIPGGIWNHGDSFYARFDISKYGNLWSNMNKKPDGNYTGVVTLDQFGPNERTMPATADVLAEDSTRKLMEIKFWLPEEPKSVRVLIEYVK